MTFIMHDLQMNYCANVYVIPVIMSLSDYLSVHQCIFTWQKIDQAGGPETFF